ncbi:conserved hypothetical protein [Ahrensia sp. R2A130]|nr:conserved hypothetical protein [Ahrensia sp. R2A130]
MTGSLQGGSALISQIHEIAALISDIDSMLTERQWPEAEVRMSAPTSEERTFYTFNYATWLWLR